MMTTRHEVNVLVKHFLKKHEWTKCTMETVVVQADEGHITLRSLRDVQKCYKSSWTHWLSVDGHIHLQSQ